MHGIVHIVITGILLVTSVCGQQLGVNLVAQFSMNGIKGFVTFEQTKPNAPTKITEDLDGLGLEEFDWSLHEFPVDLDSASPCEISKIGGVLPDIGDLSQRHGRITHYTDEEISLTGPNSIFGRSLLLRNEALKKSACATVLYPSGTKTAFLTKIAKASFPQIVGGTVYFLQAKDDSAVTVYSDLFYLAANKPSSSNRWDIRMNQVAADLTKRATIDRRCEDLGSVFQAFFSSDNLRVGVTKGTSKTFFVDETLSLSGRESIIGHSLAIYDSNEIIACASIIELKPRTVTAKFNQNGAKGSFTFSQQSPFNPTSVHIHLTGLSDVSTYHIHQYPFTPAQEPGDKICEREHTGSHLNPFGIDIELSPEPGMGTNDQYRVGDLSGKYGTLDGLTTFNKEFLDLNLQLFGVNSIIGRTVDIHRTDYTRWVCARISYPEPVTTVRAQFVYPILGEIILRQSKDNPLDETTIYVDLMHTTQEDTAGHDWHIHTDRVGSDFDADLPDRCKVVLGHYNPYAVELEGNYMSECSSDNQLRCELGDLVGKHEPLSIPPVGVRRKAFFTDLQLPLSGPNSVTSRSIVVHGPNGDGARLSCADVLIVPEVVASVEFAGIGAPVYGMLEFSQVTQFDDSTLKVDLMGLQNLAGGYHIHELPLDFWKEDLCSVDSVAGHWNPLQVNVTQSPPPGSGTNDLYEIGDISGKFGMLNNLKSLEEEYVDNNFPMRDGTSIMGRSVVVHKQEQNARWACADIQDGPYQGFREQRSAVASFTDGELIGYIRFKQSKLVGPEYEPSDTTVEINLFPSADVSPASFNHNWHVHKNKIGNDALTNNDRCQSAGPHYNPFHADVTEPEYSQVCNNLNPKRCEVGDLSSKLQPYNISAMHVYTDSTVSLFGQFSISNRSIVIHEANRGPARIACTDIKPEETIQKSLFTHKNMSRLEFANMLITELQIEPWLLYVKPLATNNLIASGECYPLQVVFMSNMTNAAMKTARRLDELLEQYQCAVPSRTTSFGGNGALWVTLLGLSATFIGHIFLQ